MLSPAPADGALEQLVLIDCEPVATRSLPYLGLPHPCTVFDEWSLIPAVDDRGTIVVALRTAF